MKRIVLAIAALSTAGCAAAQSGIHFLSITPQYTKDGFVLRDGSRTLRYDGKKNLTILEMRDALKLEDRQTDGRVDVVRVGDFEYTRDEPGTAGLFADADRTLDQFSEYLSAGHFREKWASLDPYEIVENRLDRPYAR